jgi:N-dimethylarginine dimethylaminohydrolase
MIGVLDSERARNQHHTISEAYSRMGVKVYFIDPDVTPPPNLMFQADLFFMTPEGAILARPASTVRAGEEILVAKRLAGLGIPILGIIRGKGVFEGADAAWINPNTVLLGTGLRTNREGFQQVKALLSGLDVEVIHVGLPYGSMHLMGTIRFADKDVAICWPERVPYDAVSALKDIGFDISFIPDKTEALTGFSLNFVTLKPMHILMSGDNPLTRKFYEDLGLNCETLEIDELLKAAGGIGCLTGILERKS